MAKAFKSATIFGALGILAAAGAASGQCTPPGTTGPDVIVGDITGPSNYISLGGIEAFSVGTYSCNIGTIPVLWHASTPDHPVIGQSLYKLKDGRFEQLGQSWLKHGFFALSNTLCCTGCQGTDGSILGVHCSDPYTSGRNGSQAGLGPKYQVNASTGIFTYPPANPTWSGSVARRLQARIADLEPSSATVKYFVSAQYITHDDATYNGGVNKYNNESYRSATMSGSGDAWNMGLASTTQRTRAGLRAWRDTDPTVVESDIYVPDDGLLILAAKATDLGNGHWHYEYALQNLDSDRSGQAFTIPLQPGTAITNIGFHDVAYHDGDGLGNSNFSNRPWVVNTGAGDITWSTDPYSQNPAANAIRWDTVYNFRFDANAAPMSENGATITLFKPGTPTSVSSGHIPTPGVPPVCPCDFNHNGATNSEDFFAYVTDFFASLPSADYNGNGMVDSADFFAFVDCFLVTPGPGC